MFIPGIMLAWPGPSFFVVKDCGCEGVMGVDGVGVAGGFASASEAGVAATLGAEFFFVGR